MSQLISIVRSHLSTERLSWTLYALATLCLFIVGATLFAQIVTRTLNIEVAGLQVLAQLVAVWMTFLVVGNIELENRHIEIDFFVERISGTTRLLIDVFVNLVNIFGAVVILVSALLAIQASWGTTLPSIHLPTPLLHAAPVIGMALLLSSYVWEFVASLQQLSGGR